MATHDLRTFIDEVACVVAGSDDQYEITKRVAERLSALLASGYRLPPEFVRPSPVRHLNYPLHIAPDDSWCLASVVWNVDQRTPVHGHETWGVVGIYSGAEREVRCSHYDDLVRTVEHRGPDVVVTDIRMPPTSTDEGVRAAVAFRTSHPEVGVVLLSQYLDSTYLLALVAEGSGGRAYLLKEQLAASGELAAAVRTVAAGGSFIDPLVVDSLVNAEAGRDRSPLKRLTARELETLRELANGKSNQAIATGFGVSERAVEKHVGAIFTKLDLPDDREMNRRVKAVLVFLDQPS